MTNGEGSASDSVALLTVCPSDAAEREEAPTEQRCAPPTTGVLGSYSTDMPKSMSFTAGGRACFAACAGSYGT